MIPPYFFTDPIILKIDCIYNLLNIEYIYKKNKIKIGYNNNIQLNKYSETVNRPPLAFKLSCISQDLLAQNFCRMCS